MKYIITDKNEVKIGNGYHFELASECKGKVIRAGHCNKLVDGKYEVFGESLGYKINSKKEDAEIINNIFK